MRAVVFILLAVGGGILQASLLELVALWNVKPDVLLIMSVAAGLMFEARAAAGLGAAAGLIKDALGAGPVGGQIVLCALCAAGTALLTRKLSIDTLPLQAAAALLAAFAVNVLSGIALAARGTGAPAGIFIRTVVVGSVYTALAAALLLPGIMALCPRRRRRARGTLRESW